MLIKKHMVKKIVFMGAPSTVKATITIAAAKYFNTQYAHEYGRTYWEQNQSGRRLSAEQLLFIATEHIRLENEQVLKANKYLFVDTNALTTWHFAIDYHGCALAELTKLADQSKSRYQYVFLCADDIPFEDIWARSGNVKRKQFQRFITDELKRRGICYEILQGSREERLQQVITHLQNQNA
jgi:HTH-type transcriptional repressor of NAD biosynthesis genes